MAHSKPMTPNLGTLQHLLECEIRDCEKKCQFYCNVCHQKMCEQCRDRHLRSPENTSHDVVLYEQRKWHLPVEKCKIHPTKDLDMLCEECHLPLCSKCATQKNHRGHNFNDLEIVYKETMTLYHEEVCKILNDSLPKSQKVHREIKGDVIQIKIFMDSLRTEMKAGEEFLKNMVDSVVSENIQQTDTIEQLLLEKLQSQDRTFNDYIAYLYNLARVFLGHLSSSKLTNLIPELTEKIQETQPVPERSRPVTPVFAVGQYCNNDVAKLLGKINIQEAKTETRKTKPKETRQESTNKQKTEDRRKESDWKQTEPPSSPYTKIMTFNVPDAGTACHISLDKPGRLWVSDTKGNIIQTDLQGNQLKKITTSGRSGCHTVTRNGNLIFTNDKTRVINTILDNNITELIKTRFWEPISIHSSHINGDILVGMRKTAEAKVTRYDKTGIELQNIQRDSKGHKLYDCPWYITENGNGDVCASDIEKQTVVVVNKSGKHSFSYTGQKSGFLPYGICTDALRHILVCDNENNTVDLLDKDGQFLSLVLSQQEGVYRPRGLCVDDKLYVGNLKVTVYKYLQ